MGIVGACSPPVSLGRRDVGAVQGRAAHRRGGAAGAAAASCSSRTPPVPAPRSAGCSCWRGPGRRAVTAHGAGDRTYREQQPGVQGRSCGSRRRIPRGDAALRVLAAAVKVRRRHHRRPGGAARRLNALLSWRFRSKRCSVGRCRLPDLPWGDEVGPPQALVLAMTDDPEPPLGDRIGDDGGLAHEGVDGLVSVATAHGVHVDQRRLDDVGLTCWVAERRARTPAPRPGGSPRAPCGSLGGHSLWGSRWSGLAAMQEPWASTDDAEEALRDRELHGRDHSRSRSGRCCAPRRGRPGAVEEDPLRRASRRQPRDAAFRRLCPRSAQATGAFCCGWRSSRPTLVPLGEEGIPGLLDGDAGSSHGGDPSCWGPPGGSARRRGATSRAPRPCRILRGRSASVASRREGVASGYLQRRERVGRGGIARLGALTGRGEARRRGRRGGRRRRGRRARESEGERAMKASLEPVSGLDRGGRDAAHAALVGDRAVGAEGEDGPRGCPPRAGRRRRPRDPRCLLAGASWAKARPGLVLVHDQRVRARLFRTPSPVQG